MDVLVDLRYGKSAVADRSRHASGRSASNITDGIEAREA